MRREVPAQVRRRIPSSRTSALPSFTKATSLGGRYEIQKMLGMGGMGAVYKARDMEVERVVGLKVIRPDLAGNPAILARFKQELVLARQVTHKNIIRIYDLNEADGVKFITMEFIEGEDLRTILTRQGKLSPEEAVGIILQVCAGLQAAHAEGVIHRDLKPSNIMRDNAGRVVIMDFGLAQDGPGRRHDPDRHDDRHHGVHVARAGDGQGAGCALRPVRRRPHLLRDAQRLYAVPRGERHRQPGEAHAGARLFRWWMWMLRFRRC